MKYMAAVIFALSSILACVPGGVCAEDMSQYLEETRELVKKRRYQEALQRVTWFYDHGLEHERGMSGVRNSFFLGDWLDLAERYPPAMQSILSYRDAREALLNQGKGSRDTFYDLMSLNRVLEEDDKTIDVFRELDRAQPALAKDGWRLVQDIALSKRADDLIRRYQPDLQRQFVDHKALYDHVTSKQPDPNDHNQDSYRETHRNLFVTRTLDLIKIANILGDRSTAVDLQRKALAVIDDNRLRNAVF